MSYYGQNVGAKLFIGTSTANPLPADGADTFTEVPLCEILKPPGIELSAGFFNVLNDANKRSVGGKTSDKVVDVQYVRDSTDPVHAAIESDANVAGGQKRNWRLLWADGVKLQKFVGFVSKWDPEQFDSTGDAKEHIINSTISVDGAVTG